MLLSLAETGVYVTADLQRYSHMVGQMLKAEAAHELPSVLHRMEVEVSQAVSRQMAGSLSMGGIVVYGVEMALPEAAARVIEEQMADLLARELAHSLAAWPWDEVLDSWAARAEVLMKELVTADLKGALTIDLGFDRFVPPIPVHLRLETPSP